MRAAPLPDNERERLQALFRYGVLDSVAERSFDDLTRLASQICGVPIALVSLIDEHRQWFKSRVGLDALETPRELAFCAHAILQDEVFEVPNALEDPRFADNPLVVGAPDIRFYAGAPLVTNDGFKLGTLCVIDRVPRQLDEGQLEALRILGRQVIAQLELRQTAEMLVRSLEDLQSSRASASVHVEEPGLGSEEAQRAFLAHVTHDLRTPLNAIMGFAQHLAEDAPLTDAERREIAGQIDSAGGYMLRLVNDILDVARLDSATITFAREPLAVEALARETLETIRPLALAGGNHVELVHASARRTIEGDATQVQKILFNLLSNACKYTHDGTIRLSIADEGDHWLRLDVSDTGIGMTPAQRLRLFRPFSQVHKAKVQNKQSTGLGLHITRALCERLGGAVSVASEAGVGTTFTVWLPADAAPPAPRGGAIVVAEGDPAVRAALQRALGRFAPLVFVEEIAEVLWTLVDRRWRAVILDSRSPGAEEVELVRAVERMCQDASIPLVLATCEEIDEFEGLPRWRVDGSPAELRRMVEVADRRHDR